MALANLKNMDERPPNSSSPSASSPSLSQRWVPPSNKSRLIGSLEDRNDAIFRKARGILNRLTPEKFDKLSFELLNVGIDSQLVLKGIIILIFEKALDEPKYSSLYAQLCHRLCDDAPNFEPPSSTVSSFRRLLLSRCQDEFENRSRATEAFEKKDALSTEEYEQLRNLKYKMLGNIKFIGELGKLGMVHEGILHKCIKQLLEKKKTATLPDVVEDLECLCQIMMTVGRRLDTDKAKAWMDQYFERMKIIMGNPELPVRIRFKLRDVLELRQAGWTPRQSKPEGPLTIQQVRENACRELGVSMTPPGGRPAPMMMPPPPAMFGPGTDFFGRQVNGSGPGGSPHTNGMDLFGMPAPAGMMGGLGTGPGTIQVDTFSPPFYNPGYRMRGPNPMQGQHKGGKRLDDRDSPPQPARQQQDGQQRRDRHDDRGDRRQQQHSGNDRRQQQHGGDDRRQQQQGGDDRRQQQHGGDDRRQQQQGGDDRRQQHQHNGRQSLGDERKQQVSQPAAANNNRVDSPPSAGSKAAAAAGGGRELPPRFRRLQEQQHRGPHADGWGEDEGVPMRSPYGGGAAMTPSGPPMPGGSPLTGTGGFKTTPLAGDDVSLRPIRMFTPPVRPAGIPTPRTAPLPQRPSVMGGPLPMEEPLPLPQPFLQKPAPGKQDKPKPAQKPNELPTDAIDGVLSTLVSSGDTEAAVTAMKELKLSNKLKEDAIVFALKYALDKADTAKASLAAFLQALCDDGTITTATFLEAFKQLLERLEELESEVPLVKSNLAKVLAQALVHNLISVADVAQPLKNGTHYPLFLLCMQHTHKLKDKDWLVQAFTDSKVELQHMLPEADRGKERMMEILDDRSLSFLQPMLRVEMELGKQIRSDQSPAALIKWLKDNVGPKIMASPVFVDLAFTEILSCVTGKSSLQEGHDPTATPDKQATDKETELLAKYKAMMMLLVSKSTSLQLRAIYSVQVFCYNNNFPKGMLLRLFERLYDMEIIEEQAFIKWKEQVSDEYPGKGKALFQVNQWLQWLEEAEEESDEEIN